MTKQEGGCLNFLITLDIVLFVISMIANNFFVFGVCNGIAIAALIAIAIMEGNRRLPS